MLVNKGASCIQSELEKRGRLALRVAVSEGILHYRGEPRHDEAVHDSATCTARR